MRMSLPTVSIVTPSFNHARYIEATIQSVLGQDYPDLEYIVVDGGSKDSTVQILRQYEHRLKWISEPDEGQADAINKGFGRTSGQILGWVNSDDTLAPGALAAVGEFFSSHPDVGAVYGDADFLDAEGQVIGRCQHIEEFNRHRLVHYSDFIVQPAAFFRRDVFDAVGGLDVKLNWAMDYDFWLKASRKAEFQYLPKVLANYRWLGGSKTGEGGAERLAEVERVARRYGAAGLPAYFRLEAARMHLANGNFAKALAAVATSPRAMGSLLSLKTWKIIAMGQRLRAKAKEHSKA
jgi:glycosyltransferase involved in cell wall biosynthesis